MAWCWFNATESKPHNVSGHPMNDRVNIKLTEKMNGQQTNASAKSKELQCRSQADTIATHLLLPDRTTKISSIRYIEITFKLANNL